MSKDFLVLDKVDIVTYSAAVSAIVGKFWDEDGNYTPQFGRANAIGVFFNYFVDAQSIEEYSTTIDKEIDLDFLLSNESCIELYNRALMGSGKYTLDFANAFMDAMEIVRTKNTTIAGVTEVIQTMLSKLLDKAGEIFTEETIEKLIKVSKGFSNGDLNAESIVEAYTKKKFE